MMDPILQPFNERLSKIKRNPPQIPFISNLTGKWITPAEAMSPDYWTKHLRFTVRFADGIRELSKDTDQVLLEVGPGNTLCSLARQQVQRGPDNLVLASLRHPRECRPDTAFLLETLGRLWVAGVQVNWPGFYSHEKRRRVPLPTYPFERQRYWIKPKRQPRSDASKSLDEITPVPEPEPSDGDNLSSSHSRPELAAQYVPPQNELEKRIAQIWQRLLGIEQIGSNDNFFDLGGHSLLATQVISQLRTACQVDLSLDSFFEDSTVARIAKRIENMMWAAKGHEAIAGKGGIDREEIEI